MVRINTALRAKNRAARENTRAAAILIKAKFGPAPTVSYETNEFGEPVRVEGKGELIASKEEIRSFLLNKRAVTMQDAAEEIGASWVRYWLSRGDVRRDTLNKDVFWMSERLRDFYELRSHTDTGMKVPFYPNTKN